MPTWTMIYNAHPWSINEERAMHYQKRAKLVKEWRDAFFILAKEQKIPSLRFIVVSGVPMSKNKRLMDAGNQLPALKAAVDGLVDAKIIPDDGPAYVHYVKMYAPILGDRDSLSVTITGELE